MDNSSLKRKANFDVWVLAALLILAAIGTVMVYSSSAVMADSRFKTQFFFFKKQIMWVLISMFFFLLAFKIDYHWYSRVSNLFLLFGFFLLVAVLFLPATKGVHRWIKLGPLGIQPSEVFRYTLVLFMATTLAKRLDKIREFKHLLIPYFFILIIYAALIMKQPDLGSVFTISLVFFLLLFVAKARLKHLLLLGLPGIVGFIILVFGLGYEKDRIYDYINSVKDPLAGNYQVKQSVLALGNGGLKGVGLAEGKQKFFFLPEPHTDFIFATLGEETGFIGLLGVLLLFLLIAGRGILIASQAVDPLGYFLALGITFSIFTCALINVGVVIGILPTTGVPLPFLSYGGSSLLMSFVGTGVLLNISKKSHLKRYTFNN